MNEPRLMVVAFDFGSHGAGCTFSFAYQYKHNPLEINTLVWPNCDSDMQKVPCVILFDRDKQFKAFGRDAEDMYETLTEQGTETEWFYFKAFKMQLYAAVDNDVDVRDDFELADVRGKAMSAKKVFSAAIRNMKELLTKQMRDRSLGDIEGMEHYVITVPAIWNDSCKQFMREAAEKAGISNERLSMVYEPEAASIYAKHLPIEQIKGSDDRMKLQAFNPGRKFVVLDAGGGTIDISTQAVSEGGDLKIIHKVRGGPWGGEYTNKNFLTVLSKILGPDILMQYRKSHSRDFFGLIGSFERKKKEFKFSNDCTINITMPFSFPEFITNSTGQTIREMLGRSEYKDNISIKRDKIYLKPKIFVDLFRVQIAKIIAEIRQILKNERCVDVSAIMMVGGLSESEVLQNAIQNEFKGTDIEVYIPMEGSLCVLRGAVVYGHNPAVVISRICPFTFGVAVDVPFDKMRHSETKRAIIDGKVRCVGIFDILYVDEEEVKVGEKRSIEICNTYYMPESQSRRFQPINIEFHISTLKDPFYITDEGCRQHAKIIVPVPVNGQWPTSVAGKVELEIAGTEMIGTFINSVTSERTTIRFEFLPAKAGETNKKRLYDPYDTFDMDSDFEPVNPL